MIQVPSFGSLWHKLTVPSDVWLLAWAGTRTIWGLRPSLKGSYEGFPSGGQKGIYRGSLEWILPVPFKGASLQEVLEGIYKTFRG